MSRKVVVVTGASSGIGLATARLLAERGYTVYGAIRRPADGEQFSATPNLRPLLLDVTDAAGIRRAAAEVQTAVTGADIFGGLVNNAGIAVSGPMAYIPPEQLRRQFEVNVFGLVAVTQAFLPLLLANPPGRIINLSSVAGRVVTPFLGPYAASKHAVEAVSDAFRRELMPFGVKVVVIQPGPIATPVWSKEAEETIALYRHTPYGPLLERTQKYFQEYETKGLPPEAVAQAIWRALTIPNPRTRYLVAGDRLKAYLRRLLPDKTLDRLIFKLMKLNQLDKP